MNKTSAILQLSTSVTGRRNSISQPAQSPNRWLQCYWTKLKYQMQLKSINVVNLVWEKIPFNNDEIIKYNKNSDLGLYQIYGHHPSYGENSLLYIGKTESLFANRLFKRDEFIESCCIPTDIRLGRFVNSNDSNDILNIPDKFNFSLIDIVERILLKSHAPALNKQENSGLFSGELEEFDGKVFLVLNWEEYGKLMPEISNLRMSYRFWKFERRLEY